LEHRKTPLNTTALHMCVKPGQEGTAENAMQMFVQKTKDPGST